MDRDALRGPSSRPRVVSELFTVEQRGGASGPFSLRVSGPRFRETHRETRRRGNVSERDTEENCQGY